MTRSRHWKQTFNKNAEYVWLRPKTYAGKEYSVGDDVPENIAPTKLRNMWEARIIELKDWGIDTPVIDTPVIDTPVIDTPVIDTPVIDLDQEEGVEDNGFTGSDLR